MIFPKLLLWTMLLAGTLGGIGNYFISTKRDNHNVMDLLKFIVLGIIASFVVPLFLNMISSNIVELAQTQFHYLLVLAGFCLGSVTK